MQATIQSIVEKTGISEDQAKTAFETALSAIKTKLPDSVADQLDGLLNGQEFNFAAILGGQLSDFRGDAAEKLENIKDGAAETLEELKEGAAKKFDDLKEELKNIF